ncbi:MAG: DUF2849 domain-containing protein [Notoacmeibacter sp.]
MKNVSKILTANRLSDGIAVWYAHSKEWVEQVGKAYVASTKEDAALLEQVATETLAKGQHCDVVLIDVEETEGGPRPLKLRERIRAEGPTIRLDLGQQAA